MSTMTLKTRVRSAGFVSGSTEVSLSKFEAMRPELRLSDDWSERGLLSLRRWEGKSVSSVHERLANHLVYHGGKTSEAFDLDLSKLPNSPENMTVSAEKLTNYLLNPTHKDGAAKAKFFSQELAD